MICPTDKISALVCRRRRFEQRQSRARKSQFREPDQADLGSPVVAQKIFRFTESPNHLPISGHPVPTRGAVARRHERGMGCGGRDSVGAPWRSQGEMNLVSDLRGAQDERRFSVRQNRVVLTPVAGAKSAVTNLDPTGLRSR